VQAAIKDPNHSLDRVKAQVTQLVRRMLGDGVTAEQPLMEAGLDSLGAVELRASLVTEFGIELPATLTFDYPSIAALSKFLAGELAAPAAAEAVWKVGPRKYLRALSLTQICVIKMIKCSCATYSTNETDDLICVHSPHTLQIGGT
jgi:acyl carrier protein